jgi:predicted  nucleic acid-binding Zn-ribbon protein
MCSKRTGKKPCDVETYLRKLGFAVASLSDEFVTMTKPSRFKCLSEDCGYEWDDVLLNVKTRGCPKCRGLLPELVTTEQYIAKLSEVNPGYVPLEEFKNISTPILHKCVRHSVIWRVLPSTLLKGCGCNICGIEKNNKATMLSTEEYRQKLSLANQDVEVCEEYIGTHRKIKHRCNKCGYTWNAIPSNLLRGQGCPKCYRSTGERKIAEFLDSIKVEYIPQFRIQECKYKRSLPFDFYIPTIDLLIEFQGQQHYEPSDFGSSQDNFAGRNFALISLRDKIKKEYCKLHNIRLLEIPYWDYKNIESILIQELELAS